MENAKMNNKVPVNIAWFFYYGMRAFVAISAFVFLFRGEWVSACNAAAICALMFLPGFLKENYRLYLPFELDLAVGLFVFLTLFLGSLGNFYEQWWWWDDLLHLLSGILFALMSFIVVYILNSERITKLRLTPLFVAIFSICFSLALSVVWEIYEFTVDKTFGFTMQRDGLNDTMSDLIMNAIGALVVAGAAYLWMHWQKKIPFIPKARHHLQYKGPRT